MSEVLLSFRGRQIRAAEVAFLRELIAQNPTLSRRRLSVKVCEAWEWAQPNGQLRDMVCRSLMLALHRAGHIQLPAKRRSALNNAIAHRRVATGASCDTAPIAGSVASLGPLTIRLVRRAEGETLFAQLLREYHYLGYSRPVGEHLKYLVFAGERPVACLAWSSAPLKLDLRDQFVGAPKEAYRHNLHQIAYNSRYLILPWIKVPHLASHLLGRIARQISADWQELPPSRPAFGKLRGYRTVPRHLLSGRQLALPRTLAGPGHQSQIRAAGLLDQGAVGVSVK